MCVCSCRYQGCDCEGVCVWLCRISNLIVHFACVSVCQLPAASTLFLSFPFEVRYLAIFPKQIMRLRTESGTIARNNISASTDRPESVIITAGTQSMISNENLTHAYILTGMGNLISQYKIIIIILNKIRNFIRSFSSEHQ